jgi:orotate phosphoribosyltransferase
MKELLKEWAVQLYDIEALKFGDYEIKIGFRTPIYFDLRVIISYPQLMVSISCNTYENTFRNASTLSKVFIEWKGL